MLQNALINPARTTAQLAVLGLGVNLGPPWNDFKWMLMSTCTFYIQLHRNTILCRQDKILVRAIVDLHAHRSVCATVLSYNSMIQYDMIRHYYFTRTPYSTQYIHGKIRAPEACHPAIPVPPFGRPHRPGPMSCTVYGQ